MASPRVATLMFHRINDAKQGFDPKQFERYLNYLVNEFPIVIPGQALPDTKVAICLTFDDAYYDFYSEVYPLLLKHNIQAILAVSTYFIVDETSLDKPTRLSAPYGDNFFEHLDKVPFCTWQELREMSDSGKVIIASHGHKHANLANQKSDLEQELSLSKQLLEEKLQTKVNHFVYPYGRLTRSVHRQVCQLYDYGIRIGSAINYGWDHPHRFIYRIDADPFWTGLKPITFPLIRRWTRQYWWNRLRLK